MGHRRGSLVKIHLLRSDLLSDTPQHHADYRVQVAPFSAPMAHTSSKVWVSPREAAHDRWIAVKENLNRIRFDRSPFVPQAFAEFVEHLATRAEDSANEEKKRLAELEALHSHAGPAQHPWIIPFEGKKFSDNRSPVLALPSVWSPWYEYTEVRPQSPWPSPEEFKEEGDERHTSGFGRFLPVPRVKGNPTVAYKQKAFVIQNTLDFVNPVLCREPPPRFAQEEEYTIADMLMTDQHIDFRADVIHRDPPISGSFAHSIIKPGVLVQGFQGEVRKASAPQDSPPSLSVEVDSANEDDPETPIAVSAEEQVAANGSVSGIAPVDHIESELVTTEVKDVFPDRMFPTAAKGVELVKGIVPASPQMYSETTVDEDNETVVSESALDNGITIVKVDELIDIVAPALEE